MLSCGTCSCGLLSVTVTPGNAPPDSSVTLPTMLCRLCGLRPDAVWRDPRDQDGESPYQDRRPNMMHISISRMCAWTIGQRATSVERI